MVLRVLAISIAFLCSLLPLSNIRVFRRIEDIDGEFQKYRPFQNGGHLLVKLWREWYQNTGTVQISRVLCPVIVFLVTLLCAWPLLKCQARNKHQEDCQEKGANDRGVESFVSLAFDVAICCGRYAYHVDSYDGVSC